MEGATDTFDAAEKGKLLTDFYANFFRATEKQMNLPKWADLDRQFARRDLDGLPRIDGPLLNKATHNFKCSKSCANDSIVAEMLSVLDEDILESLAEAFTKRGLNAEGEFIWKAPKDSPHVVRYPYDHGPTGWTTSGCVVRGPKPRTLLQGPPVGQGRRLGWSAGTTQQRSAQPTD